MFDPHFSLPSAAPGRKTPQNSSKLAIRSDHPRRQIKIKLCMLGGLRCVVIHVKCHLNRLRGYGAVEGRQWPFLPHYFGQWLTNSLYYRTSRENCAEYLHFLHTVTIKNGIFELASHAAQVVYGEFIYGHI